MANPAVIEINLYEINLVASSVTSGSVKVLDRNDISYSETYRMSGQSAPDSVDEFFPFLHYDIIASADPIDVYIYPRSETRTGSIRIRVDI